MNSAKFEARQGLLDLKHEHEHLESLEADLGGVKRLVDTASQLREGGARLVEVLQSSSEAGGSCAAATAHLRDELHSSCEENRSRLQQVQQSSAAKQAAADAHHVEAMKLLSTYSERLGLKIDRAAPQTVRMVFSLLDPKNPGREFAFTLGLDDSQGYCVKDCIPAMPELAKLIEELNATADSATSLPRFVCGMRRAFIKIAGGVAAA